MGHFGSMLTYVKAPLVQLQIVATTERYKRFRVAVHLPIARLHDQARNEFCLKYSTS